MTPRSGGIRLVERNSRLVWSRKAMGRKARAALESQNIKPGAMEWVEIDNRPDCSEIQDYLQVTIVLGVNISPCAFFGWDFLRPIAIFP
ncbi:hypothetical protein Y032_0257g383 [Ancylostoma ceylanicum]|nr:hypothetical protein Y032_0257g383 [Ancylostoma ceylanicum]